MAREPNITTIPHNYSLKSSTYRTAKNDFFEIHIQYLAHSGIYRKKRKIINRLKDGQKTRTCNNAFAIIHWHNFMHIIKKAE